MLFLFTLLASLFLSSLSIAAPVEKRQTTAKYYLETYVTNGVNDTGTYKGGLFVCGYHTGAGLGDATLCPNSSNARPAFMNGTYQQFDYNTTFPWGMYLGYDAEYAGWEPVQINVGQGSEGFYFNASGFQGAESLQFEGWLACDWWHGVPQLFWLLAGYESYQIPLPTSCSIVDLVPIGVGTI